jgi:hypothetical protein
MGLLRLSFIALVALSTQAQINTPRYVAIKETVLAAAAEKVTVQQPTGASRQVNFTTADVYCSVACQITFQVNGTAATATTLAPVNLEGGPSPTALAFSGSNVGSGTTLKSYYISAGSTFTFDISQFYLVRSSTGASNFSIGTNSITGTVRIQIEWQEQQ